MNATLLAILALDAGGYYTPETYAARIEALLIATPADDPRRVRVEQLLATARERRDQARADQELSQ